MRLAESRFPTTEASAAPEFSFPSLKMPFPAGPGQIIFGYGPRNRHNVGGNVYSLDFCQDKGCTHGKVGDPVMAPTDLTLEYSEHDNHVDGDPDDYHIFEVATNNTSHLCMALGHFEITVLGGLSKGQGVPRGTLLGHLLDYKNSPSSTSVPHIHMGMWTMPHSVSCAGDYTQRQPVAFVGPYRLDGRDFSPGESQLGRVTSTNTLRAGINHDKRVDILDYNILVGCYSDFQPPISYTAQDKRDADLNGDGRVDQRDYNLFLAALRPGGPLASPPN